MRWPLPHLAVTLAIEGESLSSGRAANCAHANMKDEGCEPSTTAEPLPEDVGHVRAIVDPGAKPGAFVDAGSAKEAAEYSATKRVTEAKESTALTMDAGRKADEGAISPPALPLGLHWPQPKRPASFIEEPASFLQQQAKVCAGGSLLVVTGVGALGFLYSQNMASLPDVCIMALFLGLSLALDISIVAMSESHGGKLAYEKLTVVVLVE
jgi:hypothetical protein